MIKKLKIQEIEQSTGSEYTIIERVPATSGQMHDKINELCDVVNKLETMAKNTNTVLESLVQENNIHEKQIDELQMKVEPEKCEPAENGKCAKNTQDETPRCPFCQQELVREGSNNYWCKRCNLERYSPALYGSKKLWWALGFAVDALKEIRDVGNWTLVFTEQEIADQALGQITAPTKGGDNVSK